ncbi:MAG: hypothetical protein ABFE08_19945 [Armatimonadia bacterium]
MMHRLFVLVALLMAAGLLQAAEPEVVGGNLVSNGGFEAGTEGWSNLKLDDKLVREGTHSAVLDNTKNQDQIYFAHTVVPIQAGHYYRLSMDLHRLNGEGYVYVHCNWYKSPTERLMISKNWAMPRAVPISSRTGEHVGRWSRLSGILYNPNADLGGVQIVVILRNGADVVHVDDVKLEEIRFPEAPAWKLPEDVTFPGSPSKMGMSVQGVKTQGGQLQVTTTGARYDLDPAKGSLTCYQRIPSLEKVASVDSAGLKGQFKVTRQSKDVVVLQSADVALGFQGDSLVTIATNKPLKMHVIGHFGAKHLRRSDPHLLAVYEQGGFCVMPYSRPSLRSDGTLLEMPEQDCTKPGWVANYSVGAREMVGLAVFPGRPFDWAKSFKWRIVNTSDCPEPEALKAYSKYANVLFIFSKIYKDHQAGDCHAPYTIKEPARFRACIAQAHKLGMQVIIYRHPTSYEWAGQTLDQMLADMKQCRDEYKFDGWYLDGYPAWASWMDSYTTIRRLRQEIGDRALYVHCTLNPPVSQTELYCPFIDSYCDFLLRGEGQTINGPDDPYMRYVINTQNISNSIATLKGDKMLAAAGSDKPSDLRLQLETMLKLNGRCRWAYPKWPMGEVETDPYRGFYFPELDKQQAEWERTRKPLPMRWP